MSFLVGILNITRVFKYEQADICVTSVVQNLYTCMHHEIGRDALTHYLNKHPDGILPSTKFLLTLSEMILTTSFFKCLDFYYLQLWAALLLFWACEKRHLFINHCKTQFWSRLLCGKFLLMILCSYWEVIEESLLWNSIKLIHFLDLTHYKGNNSTIETTIKHKPFSINTLVTAECNHPKQLYYNTPTPKPLKWNSASSKGVTLHHMSHQPIRAAYIRRGNPC